MQGGRQGEGVGEGREGEGKRQRAAPTEAHGASTEMHAVILGRGDGTVGNPHRAQVSRF